MENDSLQIIKSTIKALIISTPNNVSVEQLNQDYHENIGTDIPYRKMGYNSLESFLHSIPETVQICRVGNMAIVKNVSDAKTSHIEQFVRNQKKTKRRTYNNHRNIQRHVIQTPTVHSQQSHRNLGNSFIPNTYYRNMDLYMAASIARANTVGMQQYKNYNHQKANCSLQFTSQIPQQWQQAHRPFTKKGNIAKRLQQSEQIQYKGKGNSAIKQQIRSKANDFCAKDKSLTLPASAPIPTLPLSQKTEQKPRESLIKPKKSEQTPRESIIESQKSKQKPLESIINSQKTKQTRQKSIIEAQKNEQTQRESVIKSKKSEPMVRKSIIESQKNQQAHRDSVIGSIKSFFHTISKPQTTYEAMENDIKSQDKHCNKQNNSPRLLPSASQSQQTQQLSICQTVASKKCDQRDDTENKVDQVNLSLKKLSLKNTLIKDINSVDVLDTPPKNPSLKNEESLKRSNDSNNHPQKESQHENILNRDFKYDDFEDAVPNFAITSIVYQIDYPEDVTPFGMNFTLRDLPTVNSIVAIYVTKIESPEHFYYHIGNGIEEFECLSSEMQCFYETLSDKEYRFPQNCIRQGEICAASIHGTWHRAIIRNSSNLKRDYVKVYLVDSGYEVTLRQNEIKFLLRNFVNLPIRVQIGRLTNLKPKHDGKWSGAAVQRFQNLTFDRILYGQVTGVDSQDRSNMILCDTNGGTQKNINMILIKEKHALKRMTFIFG